MDNNNACKTIGVGTIWLKTNDGLTKTLTNIQYVLSMKIWLISLGALESMGFIVTMKDEILKVM